MALDLLSMEATKYSDDGAGGGVGAFGYGAGRFVVQYGGIVTKLMEGLVLWYF